MDTVPYDVIPSSMVARAVPLALNGVDEIAWYREDALAVIRLARGAQIGVLGGDVWTGQGSKWVPTYDSWACDRKTDESTEAFADRSYDKASQYINNYLERDREAFVYVLIFTDPKGVQ